MYNLASGSIRHDSHDRFILIAAWVDKTTIVSHRFNRLLKIPPVWGLHAEQSAMQAKKRTDTLCVARFNVADIKCNRYNPLMAKPCVKCQSATCNVKHIYFTDYSGDWNLL